LQSGLSRRRRGWEGGRGGAERREEGREVCARGKTDSKGWARRAHRLSANPFFGSYHQHTHSHKQYNPISFHPEPRIGAGLERRGREGKRPVFFSHSHNVDRSSSFTVNQSLSSSFSINFYKKSNGRLRTCMLWMSACCISKA